MATASMKQSYNVLAMRLVWPNFCMPSIKRFYQRILVAVLAHRPRLGAVADKEHFHQHARHARADEHMKQRFFHAQVFDVAHDFCHAAHERALKPVRQSNGILQLHVLHHVAQDEL